MKRLIVNADDFGFTKGVNAGIVQAYRMGIVTSTTIMANGDAFEEAIELAHENRGLGVGCHLSIVGGRSLSSPSKNGALLDQDGMLPATITKLTLKLARRAIPIEEITNEFRAQLSRLSHYGIKPTHLDTHKHSHTHPQVMKALITVAKEFEVKCVRNPFERILTSTVFANLGNWSLVKQSALSAAIRPNAIQFKMLVKKAGLVTPTQFLGVKLTGMLNSDAIRSMMESLKEGTAELMCHPGIYDDELERAGTRLKRQRQRELEALSDPSLRLVAERRGIELIDYRGLC